MRKADLRYHHLGIPTTAPITGEVHLPQLGVYHFGYENSRFGIEWMRYDDNCKLPEIVRKMPHVAFAVNDVYEAIKGEHVIIQPNSPSEGVVVAFIEENGAPIELIQETRPRATARMHCRFEDETY